MRVLFEVCRFYFLVWLRGDPVEPRPKPAAAPRPVPARNPFLEPLQNAD